MSELIAKAGKMLEGCTECAVSAITEEGYPRVCMLTPLANDGIKTIYFATGTSTKKTTHYLKNPKAGVAFCKNGDGVTLLGKMELVTDKAERDSLWQEWMGRHFPNGGKEDPEYAPFKFTAHEATIYIEDEFETFEI